MTKGKVQASKRARTEAKEIKHLRHLGVPIKERHLTSHVSGNRRKHRGATS